MTMMMMMMMPRTNNERSISEGSQPSKGSNDEGGAKDPMKTKELEDKFNGKILENGVRIFCVLFTSTQTIVKCKT